MGKNHDFYSIFFWMLTLFFCFLIFVRMLRHQVLSNFSTFFGWSNQNIEQAKKCIKDLKSFMSKLSIVSFTKSSNILKFDWFLKTIENMMWSIARNLLSHFGSIVVPKIIHISFETTKTSLRNFLSFDQLTTVQIGILNWQ